MILHWYAAILISKSSPIHWPVTNVHHKNFLLGGRLETTVEHCPWCSFMLHNSFSYTQSISANKVGFHRLRWSNCVQRLRTFLNKWWMLNRIWIDRITWHRKTKRINACNQKTQGTFAVSLMFNWNVFPVLLSDIWTALGRKSASLHPLRPNMRVCFHIPGHRNVAGPTQHKEPPRLRWQTWAASGREGRVMATQGCCFNQLESCLRSDSKIAIFFSFFKSCSSCVRQFSLCFWNSVKRAACLLPASLLQESGDWKFVWLWV